MFEAPSQARCTPPSCATESSPYSKNIGRRALRRALYRTPSVPGVHSVSVDRNSSRTIGAGIRRARVARKEGALHDFGKIHEREDGTVEIREVRREGRPLLWAELIGHPQST